MVSLADAAGANEDSSMTHLNSLPQTADAGRILLSDSCVIHK